MENKEKWKVIKDFPNYMISNFGNIKSLPRMVDCALGKPYLKNGILLKQIKKTSGYIQVSIYNGNKKYQMNLVHRLVAKHFVKGETKIKNYVNHIDGSRDNNHYSNLEWVSNSENMLHHYRVLKNKSPMVGRYGKLNNKSFAIYQLDLKSKKIKKWDCMSDVKRQLGYDTGQLSRAIKNKTKSYGYKWKKA
jgi:hypothetical protein